MSKHRTKHKRKSRRGSNKMEDIPLTPMIDVVFQLLIYFIVTFEQPEFFAQLKVFRPAPDRGPPPKETPTLIRVTVSPNGYMFNDTRTSLEGLETIFFSVAELDPSQSIIIYCTKHSLHAQLVAVLDLCQKARLLNLSVLSEK